MSSFSIEHSVKSYLIGELLKIGFTNEVLAQGFSSSSENDAIAITRNGSGANDVYIPEDFARIEIRCRSKTPKTALKTALAVRQVLHRARNKQVMGDHTIYSSFLNAGPDLVQDPDSKYFYYFAVYFLRVQEELITNN